MSTVNRIPPKQSVSTQSDLTPVFFLLRVTMAPWRSLHFWINISDMIETDGSEGEDGDVIRRSLSCA
jgi:hypothetical protein